VDSFSWLLAEAASRPVSGWDFSWLGDRMTAEPLPWDFANVIDRLACRSHAMLDLGTGGGEWLASLPYRSPVTVATESWHPNVVVAQDRLVPLGVDVVEVDGCRDNDEQGPDGDDGPRLPFDDSTFDLVVARHESFSAQEVARVLKRNGQFATQQLGVDGHRAHGELFGVEEKPIVPSFLELVTRQLQRAHMNVDDVSEAVQETHFYDIGALVWFLRMVPWAVPDFSVEQYRRHLETLHERMMSHGPLRVGVLACYLVASRI
jgi:SAM-dependent methyltransferase